ncbi:MAG: response regulator, partial [Planctomycetota bacterium]
MTTTSRMPRVLLVDPEPRIWGDLPKVLAETGIQVELAQDFDAAVEELEQAEYDLVLADVDEVGTGFLGRARRSPGDPLVILCDTFGSPEDGAALLDAGAFDFLPRPTSAEQAAACV